MLTIADISFNSPLILAPLAGYTDLPFRLLCGEYGAGLTVSEMISCHGLLYGQEKTKKMLASTAEDKPVSFQLFGADPEIMGEATALLNDYNPTLIDINMGCPVKKVTKRGAGSALMKDIHLAEKIVSAVCKQAKVPVTVKTRAGINQDDITALEFTRMCESAGASAITIHGRTWAQGFTGVADWEIVAKAKKIAAIPVIGNGDIDSYTTALAKIEETGCDGVMIGRAALGNPWVFNPKGRPDTLKDIMAGVKRHLELMQNHLDTRRQLAYIRNHTSRYFSDFSGCSQIRQTIHAVKTFAKLEKFIASLQINE
jgi:tRNA-dihydrouridine synthase B